MADISKNELKAEIEKILKNVDDLSSMSRKSVRVELEKKFGVDLMEKKDIIGQIVLKFVEEAEEQDNDKSEEEEEEKPEESSSESEKEVKNKRSLRKRKSSGGDEKAKKKRGGGKGKGGGGGYTKSCKLSPALSELVGAPSMPRYEVVKQVWAIIKKNNLYDPNNKQFAICDDALHSVIGIKRFRIFGMMKYLKNHFLD